MRCLVTGGAGFVGSNVTRRLLEHGYEVTVFDNCSTGYQINLKPYPEAEFIRGDIRDVEAVETAIFDEDGVLLLAASAGNKNFIEDSNPISIEKVVSVKTERA